MNLDKTWCDFWCDCKQANKCDRKLTDEIKHLANGIPLSHFLEKPPCYDYLFKENKK